MRLTTKGRFAVTAMVDLAMHGGRGPVTLASISERQKISLSYLEQLESVRGPGGGYYLARTATKIKIAEIVVAVDEPLDATHCAEQADCHDGKPCLTHNLWMSLNEKIYAYLDSVNLQQLVEGQARPTSGVTAISMNKMAVR
jgi:Rrf2 family iron-sulfur cluster assembly transcriptional regulator